MKKAIHKIAVLSLLFTLILAACAQEDNAEQAEAPEIQEPERIVPVVVAPVDTGDIYSQISYAGTVRAAESIAVASRLQGMVANVMVDTGDFVTEGDTLFTMDPVDLQNNINSLQAQLATAEASVNAARTGVAQAGGSAMQQQILQATGGVAQAETGLAQAQTQVEQATLAVSQAQSAFDTASQNYIDTASLFTAGVASRLQYDQAESARNSAQIALEQATNGLGLAQTAQSQAETALNQARESQQLVTGNMPAETRQRAQDALSQAIAARESIAVNLAAARERLSDAAITSPISGVVASRNVEPSTMLMPGIPPFTIVSADMVRVSVEVTELIINAINPGDAVQVYIFSASDEPFYGEVVTVSPAASEMTSTFTVEVDVDNRAGLIRPGMFAEVFFTRAASQNALIIPRAAIIIEVDEQVVFVAEGETAVRRPVITGIDTGTEIEILDGLSQGDSLIVTGQTFVTDGVAIQIVEEGA